MKKLLVFVALVSMTSALSEDLKNKVMEKLTGFAEGCIEETHASDDDVAELIAKILPPSTHEGKCMLFCFHKRFNIQKEDGSLDRVGALKALEPLKEDDPELYEKVLDIATSCGSTVKIDADPCITATNLIVCARDLAKAAGIDDSTLMG